MSFRANTMISIKRGTVVGEYGDDEDSDEVIASDVPASILPKPVTGTRPASGRRDTPRTYFLRAGLAVDLRQDDRVVDERTGRTYVVTTMAEPANFIGLGSVRADLQRVT